MMMAYRAAGITIPRDSIAQSAVGMPVFDPNQLRPGNLLFVPGSDVDADQLRGEFGAVAVAGIVVA